MAAHQIPQGDRGRGGRGESGKPAEAASKTSDGPPTQTPPPSDPSKPTQTVTKTETPDGRPTEEDGPPGVLYWIITALVLLALWLAWKVYQLKQRMADAAKSDPGKSLFVSTSAAQAGASEGLAVHGLDKREDWRPYLWAGGVLVRPLEPVLVQQIDTADPGEAFYYLVPFGQDLASVKAVACVDGVTGEYLECTRFEAKGEGTWGQTFAPWQTARSTRDTIAERKINLRLPDRTEVRKTDIGVHPHLVWKPCSESQSLFLPFRLVKVGNAVRYIRIDGEVFEKLNA